jgi:hypothetical protein
VLVDSFTICDVVDCVLAGQWKYGQDRVKLQWAQRGDSKSLLAKLSSSKLPVPAAAAAAVADAAIWDVLAEAPVDPLTGKLPLLLGAEDLGTQFWSGSKPGRAMLEQVGAVLGSASTDFLQVSVAYHACGTFQAATAGCVLEVAPECVLTCAYVCWCCLRSCSRVVLRSLAVCTTPGA